MITLELPDQALCPTALTALTRNWYLPAGSFTTSDRATGPTVVLMCAITAPEGFSFCAFEVGSHDLRHSAASALISGKASVKQVQ